MGWWWCCCGFGCVYFEDSFECEGSGTETDLGGNYTELSGDWWKDCTADELVTDSSNAVLRCEKANPDADAHSGPGDTAVIATATLTGAAEGDQLRILVDYVDADNYWFGEVEWGPATGTGALRLYQRSAGTNTLKGRASLAAAVVGGSGVGGSVIMTVCIGDGRISVGAVTEILVADATESTSTCGLATGTVAGAVNFDDFELSKHKVDDSLCPDCALKPCAYFDDDFDRSDNGDLGDDWTETAGAWSIVGETLRTGSANAKCTCECDEPEGNNALRMDVQFKGTAVGDQIKIHADTCYLLITYKAGNKADVELYNTGGQLGSTEEIGLGLNTWTPAFICIGPAKVAAKVTTIFCVAGFCESNVPTGSTAALGTGTLTGTASFDDVVLNRHHVTLEQCEKCHVLECWCCVGAPDEWVVDLGSGGWATNPDLFVSGWNPEGCVTTVLPCEELAGNSIYRLGMT